MRSFSGRDGVLYAVSERVRIKDIPLLDCGDGWDYRAPEWMRYWSQGDFSLAVTGEDGVRAVEVFYRSCRVGLNRCLPNADVRVSGSCLPVSLHVTSKTWELVAETVTVDSSILGTETRTHTTKPVTHICTLDVGECEPIDRVMVWLPSGQGAFIGIGTPEWGTGQVKVEIEEGIEYEPW